MREELIFWRPDNQDVSSEEVIGHERTRLDKRKTKPPSLRC